jgi:hypothetical protein
MSPRALVGAATLAALAVGGAVIVASNPAPAGCVARPRGVRTCLRTLPARGVIPETSDVIMSEGTPFPATEAHGIGCVPVECPK